MSSLQQNGTKNQQQATEAFIFRSNCICLISSVFGILSIVVILRYTTKTMLNYRPHLLNMAVTILICKFLQRKIGVIKIFLDLEF
jgi:hypothetical protein